MLLRVPNFRVAGVDLNVIAVSAPDERPVLAARVHHLLAGRGLVFAEVDTPPRWPAPAAVVLQSAADRVGLVHSESQLVELADRQVACIAPGLGAIEALVDAAVRPH